VIADAEGFEAVSIRRVAAALGAGPMSLYRYISAKSDLVALMDDAIMGEALVPGGQLPADWRAALAMIARRTRAALLAHPWAVQARPGPAQLAARFERGLAALLDGAASR
jgi:AcrR family transcriptional regulator